MDALDAGVGDTIVFASEEITRFTAAEIKTGSGFQLAIAAALERCRGGR